MGVIFNLVTEILDLIKVFKNNDQENVAARSFFWFIDHSFSWVAVMGLGVGAQGGALMLVSTFFTERNQGYKGYRLQHAGAVLSFFYFLIIAYAVRMVTPPATGFSRVRFLHEVL